mgnify:CR=1 FL=1
MNLEKLPLTTLKGVGSKLAEKLTKLGLTNVQDLLFHLPLRYEDRTHIYAIQDMLPGLHGAILGEIKSSQVSFGQRKILTCKISDGTGSVTLRFFHLMRGKKMPSAKENGYVVTVSFAVANSAMKSPTLNTKY